MSAQNDPYSTILALSERLLDPSRRSAALKDLRSLADTAKAEGAKADPSTSITHAQISLTINNRPTAMELLVLPSIFKPESWTFTFLQGMFSVPLEEYSQKTLLEVGAGSGFVSIALAKFTALRTVVGVDLNPQSPALAYVNAWLNCDEATVSKLRFAASDLLKTVPDPTPTSRRYDYICGCIPQVLLASLELPSSSSSSASLLDLSNYATLQNVYEDRFGLGLIAALLDAIPDRLEPSGSVLLNLAGRPGRGVISRMFSKRGYEASVSYASRVSQAADTDIAPLVELEGATGGDFEFYMDYHSAQPMRAKTALEWLKEGHAIWHEVAVWHAAPRSGHELIKLRSVLASIGLPSLLSSVDLTNASAEQLNYVITLAGRLAPPVASEAPQAGLLPYTHESGDESLRVLVSQYLQLTFGLRLKHEENVFVGPERVQTLYSILLAACDAGDGVLISRNIQDVFRGALHKSGVKVTVTNNTLSEILRLMEAFTSVKVVVVALSPEERSNTHSFRQILSLASRRGIIVVVDESDFFHITSQVESRTVLEFLARETKRCKNLVVMCGLTKNAVYKDYELTLVLHQQPVLQADLEIAAEVSYSRIGTLLQWLYEKLFSEMFSFRVCDDSGAIVPPRPDLRDVQDVQEGVDPEAAVHVPRSNRMKDLASHAAFSPRIFDPKDPRLIRLDYGENERVIPTGVKEAIIVGSLSSGDDDPGSVSTSICAFLLESRSVRYNASEIVFGQGVWPLVHDFGVALRTRQPPCSPPPHVAVLLPCYGLYVPTLSAAGCRVTLFTLEEVLKMKGAERPDALLITQPANPSGEFLRQEELFSIANYVVEQRIMLLCDEIFGLVNLTNNLSETVPSPLSVEQVVPGIGARTVLMCGVSKEYAAGGLRLGFAAVKDEEMRKHMREAQLGNVTKVVMKAAGWIYGAWLRERGGGSALQFPGRLQDLRDYQVSMCRELTLKREIMLKAFGAPLSSNGGGFEATAASAAPLSQGSSLRVPPRAAGGLFIAPNVAAWMGRKVNGQVITTETLPSILYKETGVVVNGGKWCGDNNLVRIVFSVPLTLVEEAAKRITGFVQLLE